MSRVLAADLTWSPAGFAPGLAIALDAVGRISAVGPLAELPPVTHPLPGRALLPGFVNGHSHAFQRGLRGRGETFPAGVGSFWTWREAMYGLVESLDADGVYRLSRQAFAEMRAAGITTVGEFHYLHHLGDGLDWAGDAAVRAAAREVGLRLVLLQTYYAHGGIGEPLGPAQQRFRAGSLDAYWRQLDHLAADLDPTRESLGVVAHSIRAATPGEILALAAGARERGLPLHLHVEEQRQEIAACLAAYGQRPMELLLEQIGVDGSVTAVHCTHTSPADLARFAAAGGNLCLCPTTEANLGDGFADLPTFLAAGGHLCLGTDSNARISMVEEKRWAELAQRLRHERRGVLTDAHGRVAPGLLAAATKNGARALGIPAGELTPGSWADFTLLDLTHPDLHGATPETLLESLIFGAGNGAVAGVWVGGEALV